jgi:thiamine-triphosphatase
MACRKLPSLTAVLEVERKFHSLAVKDLKTNSGHAPFHSIRSLGESTFRDVYYNKSDFLSSSGIWLRRRNGDWQAKFRKGGDRTNPRFEELSDINEIGRWLSDMYRTQLTEQNHFGLKPMASLSTLRKAWVADDKFGIVLDTTDFDHTVGVVELEVVLELCGTTDTRIEDQKAVMMEKMDEQIVDFMSRYSWAFQSGTPKGKLTAYFEWKKKCS